ncbi:uncharacterized protein LOC127102614 [Lathyrus oleraceus]|uniref:uncharacterized protein LOC127102614 n=1 Tax=Pisum sativum TaxID=3888 RepID=UPI0021D26F2D|nr:uncharacterized protein LOC127102614 [Pisum sativum]
MEFTGGKIENGSLQDCAQSQTAFVPGRQLLDGVLVINEILDYAKKARQDCLLLKVDFELAYDCVNWDFMQFVLLSIGCRAKWMKWMEASIFNNSLSILVNRNPTDDFSVECCLRQGDQISHFLFVLAAEGLTCLINKVANLGKFSGFSIGNSSKHLILQFVDDTIIIGKDNWENVWSI